MIRKRIWTVGLLGLAWVPQLYAGSAVTLSTNEVAITGLAPGGTGVLIAVARELSEGIATVVVRDGLLPDTDGDGAVSYALDAEPALQSVWLGFDLATPEPTAAVPSGFSIQAADSKAVDLVAKPAADELVIQLPYAQVWWSRPGLGVWAGRFGDGGEGDLETGVDGVIGVDLGSLVALGSSGTAPAKAQAGDWVVVIDPGSLALYTAQVVATSPGNSGQEALTLAPVQLGEVTP